MFTPGRPISYLFTFRQRKTKAKKRPTARTLWRETEEGLTDMMQP